ncbi:MAG: ROK family protein [Caldilineaceae bacterium]|nr:ROK family protein [Caldilineaceae bacterium]HRJ43140.1 ROK family protein [Caldilineaceae bacterium]
MSQLFGAIEAGGTKFVCAVGSGPGDIRAESRFPTTTPGETIAQAIAFFQEQELLHGPLQAIGISAFGPIDPHPKSPTFGTITTTPKLAWQHTPIVGMIRQHFDLPIGFDTDVNGAALGEHHWGAAQGLDTFVYLTIGTGIGGGGMVGGRLIHGLMHPEMGHMYVPHDWDRDPFPGVCPFHGDCLEGLANGPALEARWGTKGESFAPDHEAWLLEAHYLALGLVNIITILSPQRIILGGGVMGQPHIFPLIHREVRHQLKGYIQMAEMEKAIDSYIVPPGLGSQAGVLGSIALAKEALKG